MSVRVRHRNLHAEPRKGQAGLASSPYHRNIMDLNAAINIKWAGNARRGETHQLIGEAKASQNKVLLKRESKTAHDACMEQAA